VTRRATYSIGALANAAGVSRRTVRFYVERGLLAPPEGLGRGARYTDEHLARLLQIKGWQEAGVALEEIHVRVHAEPEVAERRRKRATAPTVAESGTEYTSGQTRARLFVPGQPWFRQPLVAGFELHVAGGRPPLTARQLAALASALKDISEEGGEKK
jgi:DNA-binding transcriptional MerR regulator